jgi:enoyl-CoA hydratase/carnithine racemase
MDEVLIETDPAGAVRTITLNRPEKRNALTREMFARLQEAFEQEPGPTARVTVIAAEGPSFCAGVDLGERSDNASGAGASPLELLCEAVRAYPLPVVAAVQGAAIGGGAMLALHCDFVVAVADAKIGNAAVQMGLVPAWLPARRVGEVAGEALARELLLLGEIVPAERLARAFVIAAAVPAEELQAEVDRVVGRLAANAPLSLRAIKATLTTEAYAGLAHVEVDAAIARAQASDDAKEGVAARRERRPAQFAGR